MDVDRVAKAKAIADLQCALQDDGYVRRALIHLIKGRFAGGETEVTDGESVRNRKIAEFAWSDGNPNRNPTTSRGQYHWPVQTR
jgi:hypothetical protein